VEPAEFLQAHGQPIALPHEELLVAPPEACEMGLLLGGDRKIFVTDICREQASLLQQDLEFKLENLQPRLAEKKTELDQLDSSSDFFAGMEAADKATRDDKVCVGCWLQLLSPACSSATITPVGPLGQSGAVGP